jgi:hypothetical protein
LSERERGKEGKRERGKEGKRNREGKRETERGQNLKMKNER